MVETASTMILPLGTDGRQPARQWRAGDGADLRKALDAVLEGRPAPEVQRPSLGCNIKWKPGNAPAHFAG